MKKVLVVTYYFPPSGGSGVQRVLKFVKYLPEFGWEPVVLTVKESASFPVRDESLKAEIPEGITVVRTPLFEPYGFYRTLTGRKKGESLDIAANTDGRDSLREKVSEWIRAAFFIPDARIFWKRRAVREGRKLIRRHGIHAILSSAPPYTCHLIGRDLKRGSGLPWAADFRDSWVGWLSAPARRMTASKIDLAMEGSVLNEADRILHVTRGVREDLFSRHSSIEEDKWDYLPNGYDSADFPGPAPPGRTDRFILTYTGSLYGKRNPRVLLEAVDRMVAEKPGLRDKLLIRFVGRVAGAIAGDFERFGPMIETVPYVDHAQSICMLRDSSALLLIVDDAPQSAGIVTGKLYEYIGSGKPILALAPAGEASDLIFSLGAGRIADPGDPDSVRRILERWLEAWEQGRFRELFHVRDAGRFERRELTRQLAEILNRMME
ncbi:glycosyltransferase family 4 protein [bacterium]|nr:glycosyltransferase family 4 protein [bacterium]